MSGIDAPATTVSPAELGHPTLPRDAVDGARRSRASAPVRRGAERHGWRVLAILSALMGFGSISTDVYLPAMPVMGDALRADPGAIEFTVSGYLVGFSLGQLLWGPVGDRYGRRLPVAAGLVLFVFGSAGCGLSDSAAELVGWRVLQALGACAGVVLARAMVRDLYAGERAARMMSTLMTVMAVAPLLGPILGGRILELSSWRAIFWVLVGVGLATLVALLALPETHPTDRRNRTPLSRAFADYGSLLGHRRLVGYASAGGFFYAAMFAYIAGSPFAYVEYHHVPARLYGLLFGAGILGIMATNLANARFVPHLGGGRMLRRGTLGAAAAAALVTVDARTGWGGLWGLVVPLFLFVSATGFIVANSIAGALDGFPDRASSVSALVGALQYGSGIVGSGLVGLFADGTPWTMGWVIAACSVGSAVFAFAVVPNPGDGRNSGRMSTVHAVD